MQVASGLTKRRWPYRIGHQLHIHLAGRTANDASEALSARLRVHLRKVLLAASLLGLVGCGPPQSTEVDSPREEIDAAPPDGGFAFDEVSTSEDRANLNWVFVPFGQDRVVTGLAASFGSVYFVAKDLERYSVYAVASDGKQAWRTSLPLGTASRVSPIVAENGDVLVFGNEIDALRYKGSWAHRFSAAGEHLWTRALIKPMPSNSEQHGIKSAAPAIDSAGNVYLVLEDELVSLDAHGERRWAVSANTDVYGCGLDGGTGWSPLITDDRVILLGKGGEFITVTLDGEVLYRGQLDHCPEHWPVLRQDGAILMANSGYVASYNQLGSRTRVWPGLSDDDTPVVFSGPSMFVAGAERVTRIDGDDIAWTSPLLTSSPLTGLVAGQRETWFLATSPLPNITVLSQNGLVGFSRNPGFWPEPEWDSVVIADGTLTYIATGRDQNGNVRNGLVCIFAPVGVPSPDGWRTRNADYRNQRRVP